MTSAMNITHFLTFAFSIVLLGSTSVVYADTIHIENTVESYMHTGGNMSTSGQDGQRGEDGADGKDGTSGTQGKDGSIIHSSGTASVSVESYVNGEKVIDIHETDTSDRGVSVEVSETYEDERQNTEVVVSASARGSEAFEQPRKTLLAEIISTIRLITAFLW